jgi:hypothetical protein
MQKGVPVSLLLDASANLQNPVYGRDATCTSQALQRQERDTGPLFSNRCQIAIDAKV